MRRRVFHAVCAVLVAVLSLAHADDAGFARLFDGVENAFEGSPGQALLIDRIKQYFDTSGVQWGVVSMDKPVFVPGEAWLEAGQVRSRMHTLHPNESDLCNFDESSFAASLVYLGRAAPDSLRPASLKGALVLLEFDCHPTYVDLMTEGVRGFVFIEPDAPSFDQAEQKILWNPVTVPRYQIARAEGVRLRERCLAQGEVTVRVEAQPNRWEVRSIENLWALSEKHDPRMGQELVVLSSALDTFHYCPELPGGGSDFENLRIAVQAFEERRRDKSGRSTLLLLANSRYQQHFGASHLIQYALAKDNTFFSDEPDRDTEAGVLRGQMREAQYLIDVFSRYTPEHVTAESIRALIDMVSRPAGRNVQPVEALVRLVEYEIFVLEQKASKIIRQGRRDAEHDELARIQEDVKARGCVVDLMKKFGGRSWGDLSAPQHERFEHYRRRLIANQHVVLEQAQRRLTRLDAEIRPLRDAMEPFSPVVSLSPRFSFKGESIGMFPYIHWAYGSGVWAASRRNAPLVGRVGWELAQRLNDVEGIRWDGQDPDMLGCSFLLPNSIFWRAGVPSYTFVNTVDAYAKRWTGDDTLDRIHPDHAESLARIFKFSVDLVSHEPNLDSFLIVKESRLSPNASGFWETKVQDGSSLARPQTIMPNAMVVLFGPGVAQMDRAPGILPYRLYATDESGVGLFHGLLPREAAREVRLYGFDDQGRHAAAIDRGSKASRYTFDMVSLSDFTPSHLLAGAAARKADVYELLSPRDGEPIDGVILRGTHEFMLQTYSVSGLQTGAMKAKPPLRVQPVSFFLPEGSRVRMLFPTAFVAGVHGVSRTEDRGVGTDDFDRRRLADILLKDVMAINQIRLDMLENNGVSSTLLAGLHEKALDYETISTDATASSGQPSVRTQNEPIVAARSAVRKALGSAYIAYAAIKQTLNDLIKAVVFYMAVMLPFCFFLQRLLFNPVKIQHQMLAFMGLFGVTYLFFYHSHPAFRVAQNPQIILVSFITLALVFFVGGILRNKFDYHMTEFAGKISSDASWRKLAGKAFLIGVSNMRRRKLRTTLTCVTIILVTFTMLSFTSVTETVAPTTVRKSPTAPYNGIFFADMVWQPLTTQEEGYIRQFIPEGEMLERRMSAPKDGDIILTREGLEAPWRLMSLLGLSAREDGWLGNIPLVAGRFFSSDTAREVVLTQDLVEALDLGLDLSGEQAGRELSREVTVTIKGQPLTLVGVVDARKMSNIQDLRCAGILPKEFLARPSEETLGEDEEASEDSYRDMNPLSYAIVPVRAAGFGLRPFSVSIRLPSAADAWQAAQELVATTRLKFYFGCREPFALNPDEEEKIMQAPGSYFMKSGMKASIGGIASLLIPLLVSATIIFNTLLSSVYERKKEIAMFNSVGLSPLHVGFFFVAESVVFGVVGSVSGYLLGQVFARIISALDLFSSININYSSTTVVYVILFTIFIVVAASIYPAYVAFRTASSSSGLRRLSIEDDDKMRIRYPFSFSPHMVPAVHAYLREYLDLHADQSVGEFIATEIEPVRRTDDELRYTYSISLAPFDLGVRQNVTYRTFLDPVVGAHMLDVLCVRQAGQDTNWLSVNRPFVNRIRKHLLRWRALSPQDQEQYREAGEAWLLAQGVRLESSVEA